MVAGDGTVLVGSPSSHKIRGKFHVFSETIDGKNMTLTLTVPDADMYKRLRKSTLFFALMALTGILSVVFIAYRSVQNLWKLNEVRLKDQQIEDELSIARNIQTALLPDKSVSEAAKNVDICGMQLPAKYVGGDLTMLAIRFVPEAETLTLANDIQELKRIEPFLNDFFERNNLDPTLLPSVNLALEEALANVIMYAYPEGTRGEVTLTAEAKEDNICLEIRDMGVPFNPLQHKEAKLDVSLEERPIGGLGIHLIKEIMDEVEYAYEDGKNVLRMQKRRQTAG